VNDDDYKRVINHPASNHIRRKSSSYIQNKNSLSLA